MRVVVMGLYGSVGNTLSIPDRAIGITNHVTFLSPCAFAPFLKDRYCVMSSSDQVSILGDDGSFFFKIIPIRDVNQIRILEIRPITYHHQ
jgi:hypothetical protein